MHSDSELQQLVQSVRTAIIELPDLERYAHERAVASAYPELPADLAEEAWMRDMEAEGNDTPLESYRMDMYFKTSEIIKAQIVNMAMSHVYHWKDRTEVRV